MRKVLPSMSRNHPNYLWLVSLLIVMGKAPHLTFVKLFFFPLLLCFFSPQYKTVGIKSTQH